MTVIILTVIVAFNSILTFQRNKVWANEFTLWDDTVKKSPQKSRPHYNLGEANYKSGHITQSILDFSKAIEINPNFTDAYYNRGNANARQGNFTQSLLDYSKTIELNPNYENAYNNRGNIFNLQGNLSQALSDYNKALELNPFNEKAYFNLALVYYHLKEYDRAWGYVRKIEALGGIVDPNFIIALKKRRDIYGLQ